MGQSILSEAGYVRRADALECEGVPLTAIAERVGTPVYVYSAGVIRERYAQLTAALAGLPVSIHYSVKANSNVAVLALLRSLGAGVDIVSSGELHRAMVAGYTGDEIVFSGVGKTRDELQRALAAGVHSINVESEGELRELNDVAREMGTVARIALRVNPDVAVSTPHAYTRTGEQGMKFGIPHEDVVATARIASEMQNIRLIGLAAHVGSQISDAAPYLLAANILTSLKHVIEREGLAGISILDMGGGLGVSYGEESGPDLAAYADALRPLAAEPGITVLIEPGRFLVAESGVLLTRVLYRKTSGGKQIIITDAGMNDLIRPSLYESHHEIDAVTESRGAHVSASVVGPVCESGDFFARDRMVPDAESGDLLALRTVGAYGFSMASNYNSRHRPAEVLVDGNRFGIITERETDVDLTARETVEPEWLES